jgi:hypothetical protein
VTTPARAAEAAERSAHIARLRDELAEVRRQIASHRAGRPLGPLILAGIVCGALGAVAPWLPRNFPALVSNEEIARVRSPSNDLDAVVLETNGGATTAFGYRVHVVPAGRSAFWGAQVAYVESAATCAGARGVAPRWTTADQLDLEYRAARSAHLGSPSLAMKGRMLTVRLAPDTDAGAPCAAK